MNKEEEENIDMEISTDMEITYINSPFKQSRREVMLSVARERLHQAVREGDVENRKMLTNYKDWFNEASHDPLPRLEDDEPQSKRRRTSPGSDEPDFNVCDQSSHDSKLPETIHMPCSVEEALGDTVTRSLSSTFCGCSKCFRANRTSPILPINDETDICLSDQTTCDTMLFETIHTKCSVEEAVTRLAMRDKYRNGIFILSKYRNGMRIVSQDRPFLSCYKCDTASSELLRSIEASHVMEHGLNALHVAARHGQVEVIRMLLDNKADVNSIDINGNTALHHAAGAGSLDTMIELRKVLKSCTVVKAYVYKNNKYRTTNTMSHTCCPHEDIVKLLIEYGTSRTEQNSEGNTALHVAAALGHVTIAKLLLEHDALAVTADELQDTTARSTAEREQMKTKQQDSEESERAKSHVSSKDTQT